MDKVWGFLGTALLVALFIIWNFVLPVVTAGDCSQSDRQAGICTIGE